MSAAPELKCKLMHHNQWLTSPDWMKSGRFCSRAMWKEMKVVVYVENKVTYFNANVHVKIS